MKILYLDCGMGAAGDMLQGALLSLLSSDEQEAFINRINSIGIDGIKVVLIDDMKCGITCKHVKVYVDGKEELSHDHHEHSHDHHHHDHDHSHTHKEHDHHDHDHHEEGHNHEHHHASMGDISHMISHLDVSDDVKKNAEAIYKIIADAEAKVHNRPVSEVHFHEVGMKDALADVISVAMLMEKLNVDRVICSPVNVGFGKVKCAHGVLPVPAPATAEIIRDIPIYAGRFEGEMCTPTGAALIKHFANEFSNMPVMKITDIGYGCGNKDFDAANVVRAVIGEIEGSNQVIEYRCNIDDMTGEDLAYAVDVLMENGAKDAFVTPVVMKKGRSGFLLTVLCDLSDKDKIAELIFKHTSTIGIRQYLTDRVVLNRRSEVLSTEYGNISVKISEGFGVKRVKPEFEDLKAVSLKSGKSISEVRSMISEVINV